VVCCASLHLSEICVTNSLSRGLDFIILHLLIPYHHCALVPSSTMIPTAINPLQLRS